MSFGPLVTTAWLAEALEQNEPPTLLDVRWVLGDPHGERDYEVGHVPGAVYVDLDRELSAPAGTGGRHPLPAAGPFAAAMRAKGVSTERQVVAYDGGSGLGAARAWWLLRYFGHGLVALLDGGLAAWSAEGRPLSRERPAPAPGDFTAVSGGMPVLDAAGAAELARRGVLLDARAPERFRGESEPVDPVAGHIPGAVNLPASLTITSGGALRPPAELRAGFAAAGVSERSPVGVYCGSGVTASHTVLAAALAGIRAALYPGSWSEWITDPARPVARG